MVDVFLSYAREDRERASSLVTALRDEGLTVWWDRKILPGKGWRSTLDRMLSQARSVVVLWSSASVTSRWVAEEAEHAADSGLLIPALIENVRPPAGFRELQCADLTDFTGDRKHPGFQDLCQAIREQSPAPASAEAVAATSAPAAASTTVASAVVPPPLASALVQPVPAAPQPAPPDNSGAAPLAGLRRRKKTLVAAGMVGALAIASFLYSGPDVKAGSDGLLYRKIPGGTFWMGCDGCEPDEAPRRQVRMSGYWIGETEVTVDAYRRFSSATGRPMPPQTGGPEVAPQFFNPEWRFGDHPIVNVNYYDAQAYCRWAGGGLPWRSGDLPTEAQWEYAARLGTGGQSFPWGNSILRDRANYGFKDPVTDAIHPRASQSGARDRFLFTSPVRSFDPTGIGLYDMVGNAQEWVRDAFRPYEPGPLTNPYAASFNESDERVVRGGSFLYDQQDCRVENRSKNPPTGRYPDTGFRCVLSRWWGL